MAQQMLPSALINLIYPVALTAGNAYFLGNQINNLSKIVEDFRRDVKKIKQDVEGLEARQSETMELFDRAEKL
ncbi:hypothetical protein MMC13_006504 [Lambiella insularis]|nr:hypothetical protein [Lambiella insularis]